MLFLVTVLSFIFCGVHTELVDNKNELSVNIGSTESFSLNLTEQLDEAVTVFLNVSESGVVKVSPTTIRVPALSTGPWQINITGLSGGHVLVFTDISPNITSDDRAFIRVTVQHSGTLALISVIIGWVYFAAWSVSFYPQVYENYTRKSVIGLNFDFLSLNLVGFVLYSLFNCGLYWIPEVEQEYFNRHPRGLNPVQLNDIVFAIHATFVTLLTIAQCCCYERGDQRVSTTARFILSAFFIILVTCLGLALFSSILWLDFLYYCSYIKLTITLIKYIPQAFMNYQRKSTIGWSIGNIFLDFTGGILSMGQMILNAYNYNDWVSIFGDPTKFGLGMFSVLFDIIFFIQHYVLYRTRYESIPGEVYERTTDPDVHSHYDTDNPDQEQDETVSDLTHQLSDDPETTGVGTITIPGARESRSINT